MTFNEGMQIDTSTASSSGGGGMGRMAIGGGIGGLLVVVVAMLLGVDPGGVISQQPMDSREDVAPGFNLNQCKTGSDANKYVQCRVVATGNSVDAVWKQLMPNYTRPRLRLFSGQVSTGCGPASSDVGPFYCPVDKTAYFDTDFFQVLVDRFGSSGGPFAQEYVVAHEYGHHVQDLLGVLGRSQQGAQGRSEERMTLVVLFSPGRCSNPRGLSKPPQIVTEGVPTATAMCIGPDTGPTYRSQAATAAANCSNEVLPRISTWLGLIIAPATASGWPISITVALRTNAVIKATQFGSGQSLFGV